MKQNVIIILDANRRRELFCYWFTHGSIIEKDQQLIGLFKNIRDSAIMLILSREVKKQRDLEYLNLFCKASLQVIPSNHQICFNLNYLKVLEQQNHVQRTCKEDFLTQNKLGTPHPFRVKSDQNAETIHKNYLLSRRFQGAF